MNPPLPLLPLIDGYLFIDNSFIEKMQCCARSAEYNYLHGRRLTGERSALNFGSAWHAAMQARYQHPSYDMPDLDCFTSMTEAARKHFDDKPQPDGEYRNLSHLCNMISAYNRKHDNEPFEILETDKGKIVEHPFAVEIPHSFYLPCKIGHESNYMKDDGTFEQLIKVIYTGRIDLAIRQDNMLFTLDHKTTFMYGSGFWNDQKMTGQHVGYCWALDNILGIDTRGYVVNAACTRAPSKSRPLPDADDFQRQTYFIEPDRKAEWLENLIELIKQFLYHYESNYMPMSTKWCVGKYGACQYFDVCSLPRTQRLPMLQSGLFEHEDWSPLEQAKNIKQ